MINFSMNTLKVIMNIAVPLLNVSYNAAKRKLKMKEKKKCTRIVKFKKCSAQFAKWKLFLKQL